MNNPQPNPQNQFITREKTIVIAAMERDSAINYNAFPDTSNTPNKQNGYYEVILNKPVSISNGDSVSIKSAFIDTTKINNGQVNIEDDVEITWSNGIYTCNQQLETFAALMVDVSGTEGYALTDNKNYVLCYQHPAITAASGQVYHYKFANGQSVSRIEAVSRTHFGGTGSDGNTAPWSLPVRYKDPTGALSMTTVQIPKLGMISQGFGFDPLTQFNNNYVIDFIGLAPTGDNSYYPTGVIPSGPRNGVSFPSFVGTDLGPDGRFPDAMRGKGSLGDKGWITYQSYMFIPFRQPVDQQSGGPIAWGEYISEEKAVFFPVIHSGSATIPKGNYDPIHLAQLLTDKLAALPDRPQTQEAIEPTSPFIVSTQDIKPYNYPVAAHPWPGVSGEARFSINHVVVDIDTLERLPYKYQKGTPGTSPVLSTGGPSQKWLNWNIALVYISGVSPQKVVNYQQRTISEVGYTDPTTGVYYPNQFRWVKPLDPIPRPDTGNTNEICQIYLTPPVGEVDGGSTFVQSSLNYQALALESKQNVYCFIDVSQGAEGPPLQALAFGATTTPSLEQVIGTNQVAITYDTNRKKFEFSALHFSPTAGTATVPVTPGIIKQTTTNIAGGAKDSFAVTRVSGSTGVEDIITTSIGGVFFTDLGPPSFWTKIGFNVTGQNSTPLTQIRHSDFDVVLEGYGSGPTQVPAPANNVPYFPAVPYTDSSLTPYMDLVPGVNITSQSVTIGDATGIKSNYTGVVDYSDTAAPSTTDGRVAIPDDAFIPIIADGLGEHLGVQDSGYYIVDVEIGLQYNEFIGSSTNQHGFTKNIRMIVDRYYAANSYVSSEGDGINYIHYGNDIVISNVNVRIKNSNGLPIEQLGPDNSIFLKINKTIQINISSLIMAQQEEQKRAAEAAKTQTKTNNP
tara:strand:+ start:1638 stop:4349 length:2712 start_codon:yes stop_codon:yes gene_type:complete